MGFKIGELKKLFISSCILKKNTLFCNNWNEVSNTILDKTTIWWTNVSISVFLEFIFRYVLIIFPLIFQVSKRSLHNLNFSTKYETCATLLILDHSSSEIFILVGQWTIQILILRYSSMSCFTIRIFIMRLKTRNWLINTWFTAQ